MPPLEVAVTTSSTTTAWRTFLLTVLVGGMVAFYAATLGYGYHRDEFYYIDCGQQISAGYVDHTLFVPLVARLFGPDMVGLVLALLLAVGAIGAIGTLWSARLGGKAQHSILTALLFLGAPGVVGGAAIMGTVVWEQLAAVCLGFAVIRYLETKRTTDLAWIAACAFLAGSVKPTALLLCFFYAVVLSIRRHFKAGGILMLAACIGVMPWGIWQYLHHWPILEFTATQRDQRDPLILQLLISIIMIGPVGLAVVVHHVRRKSMTWTAWFALLGIILFAVLRGKPYYCMPFFFPALAEASLCVTSPRRWIVAAALSGLVSIVMLLPVISPSLLESKILPLQMASKERIGWKDLGRQIGELAATRKANTVILSNYGQAGALRRYAPSNLRILCGHNQYHFWEQPALEESALVVGYSRRWVENRFRIVESCGTVDNPYKVKNEEKGKSIWYVQGLKTGLQIKDELRHFD